MSAAPTESGLAKEPRDEPSESGKGGDSEPIRVEARIIAGPKSSKFTRDLAFHAWALAGGPACEISEVARAFGVPPARVYNWKERDGWDVKWQARMSDAEKALRGRSSFAVAQYVSIEQLDRSLIALYVGMTAVISGGGLNPRKKDGTDRPLVSFRVADYITVLDRLATMLRRDEDRKQLGGVLSEMPLSVAKDDLAILASLPADKVKNLHLIADGFIEFLREKDLIRRDAPVEGPGGTRTGSGSAPPPSRFPENEPERAPSNLPDLTNQEGLRVGTAPSSARGASEEGERLEEERAG